MEPSDKKRIQKNYRMLVDNLSTVDVCDYLFEAGAIDDEHLEILEHEVTTKGKVRKLISILYKNPSKNILEVFCKSLREANTYVFLAEAIEKADVSNISDEDVVDAGTTVEEKCSILTEQIVKQSTIMCQLQEDALIQKRKIQELEEQLEKIQEFEETTVDGKVVTNPSILEFLNKFIYPDPMTILGQTSTGQNEIRKPKDLDVIEKIACDIGVDILCNNEADKKSSAYVLSMRRMVESSNREFASSFDKCIEEMNRCEFQGYKTVEVIAGEQFLDNECNWGRIIAWYTFWGHFARRISDKDVRKMLGNFVGFYLSSKQREWIKKNGGWVRSYIF